MARLFIDGFEGGDASLWDACTFSLGSGSSYALYGNYGVRGNNNAYAQKNLPAKGEMYIACRVRLDGAGWESRLIEFRNGSTVVGCVEVYTTNYLRAMRGTGTALATGTHMVPQSQVFLLEAHYKPLASGGVFQVKINGLLDIDFSGTTTDGATTIDNIRITIIQPSYTGYFDNIIIDDANWIGDTLIQAIVPNANGDTSQWNPSAGQNYQCVDEIPPSAADYVSATQGAQVDLYQFTDLTGSPATIKAVQVQAVALKQGNPNPQFVQLMAKSAQSASQAVGTSAKPYAAIFETDPDTGQPWTPDAVNAAQFGVRSATS